MKIKVVLFFSFKLNTDSFIRSIYYDICTSISFNILFRNLIHEKATLRRYA